VLGMVRASASTSLAAWTLVCLLIASADAQVCDAACKQVQRAALGRLYEALGGARWRSSAGWGVGPDHCAWLGVTCCAAPGAGGGPQAPDCGPVGAIVALDLQLNGLEGTLPPDAFSGLEPALESINLFGNGLTGGLPASLSDLQRLKVLHVNDNKLGGALPAGLAGLPLLARFDFGDNAFTGALRAVVVGCRCFWRRCFCGVAVLSAWVTSKAAAEAAV